MKQAEAPATSRHSDGFIGDEATPIGRLMPVRKQHRRQPMWHKLTIRMGKLTLVAQRQFGGDSQQEQPEAWRRKKKAKKTHAAQSHQKPEVVQDGGGPTVVGIADEQPLSGDEVVRTQNKTLPTVSKQSTPRATTNDKSPLQPPTRSSPLQQKVQRNRKVIFEEGKAPTQPSQSVSTESVGLFQRHESNEVNVLQQLKTISAPKVAQVAATPKKKEIPVDYQLMAVSIPRSSMADKDSDGESEDRYAEDESELESGSDDSEEERSDTLEEHTDDERDPQAENWAEVEEEEEDVEMIDQQIDVPSSPKATGCPELLPSTKVEVQSCPKQAQVPTLRRENAQNPLEISPRKLQEVLGSPSKPNPRRCSARLPDQQPMDSIVPTSSKPAPPRRHSARILGQQTEHPYELLLDSVDKTVVGQTQTKESTEPARRKRSARIPYHNLQETLSDEHMASSFDKMVANQPQPKDRNKNTRRKSIPAPARYDDDDDDDDDDSWRPQEPATNSMPTEIEGDEIVDTPSPVHGYITSSYERKITSRRLSLVASQALSIVASRPNSPQQESLLFSIRCSQGSIELGDTQNFARRSFGSHISETQFDQHEREPEEEQEEEDEIPSSQPTFISESSLSYFGRTSQDLHQPFKKPILTRSKSMPASMHTPRLPEGGEAGMMAGGITMTAAFQRAISPVRSSGPMPTLMTSTGKEKSLKCLTRQASIELGTLPSGRKRMVSLPFVPPFKKDEK